MRIEVLRDPAEKMEETWRVIVDGRFTTPRFQSRGAAEAYASLITSGYRKPEFA